jgi:UDP-N-acetylmuramoylalanine--D-glutamate ligase
MTSARPPVPGEAALVIGVGVSGAAAAEALLDRKLTVRVADAVDGPRQRAAAARLRELGAAVALGALPSAPDGVDLLVVSPGVPPDTAVVRAAPAAGVEVWGEVELAWRLGADGSGPAWLAVTGTNGKTTTTQMLGAILAASGRRSATAGNIGTPLVQAVTAAERYEVLAVELSSFQLHYSASPEPVAAAILNIAPDHWDWHGGPDAYAAAKERIWSHPGTVAVGNLDDRGSAAALARAPGPRVAVSLDPASGADLTVRDAMLLDRRFGAGELLAVAELGVSGPHNVANALAAAALALAGGVGAGAVAAGLRGFVGGAHRDVLVDRVGGVGYVDDSKATNPHAAAASLTAYERVVWIAGGLNKGLAFDDLVLTVRDRLRAVVLIGSCADEISDALARHAPDVPVERAANMDHAVEAAAAAARGGDTVVLAPAAASMDMFRDYAERGDLFATAVKALSGR